MAYYYWSTGACLCFGFDCINLPSEFGKSDGILISVEVDMKRFLRFLKRLI
jgi:hypothetical protein